jgi:small redox-active disulfide protein 2
VRVIEILGPGCRQCERATSEIREVMDRSKIDAEVRHVTDPFEIVTRGVLFTVPVVLIDGVVMSRGRVPSRTEIERWLGVGSGSGASTP